MTEIDSTEQCPMYCPICEVVGDHGTADDLPPAPGDGAIPPAPEIIRAEPSDAGCWIDGHWGIYGTSRLVDIAMGHGWRPVEEDRAIVEAALAHELPDDQWEAFQEIADEAEQWMTDAVAPAGYEFGWHDGEWFLAHSDWWAQDDYPEYVPVDCQGRPIPS